MAISLLRSDPVAEGRRADADEVAVNLIAIGELYLGAELSADPGERLKIDELLDSLTLLVDDVDTARVYARLRTDLRRRGTPIPDNDLWIAAHALSLDAILVTDNVREFERVPGLTCRIGCVRSKSGQEVVELTWVR